LNHHPLFEYSNRHQTLEGLMLENNSNLLLGPDLMLAARPGVFCAGEMLDWEAPTGGYLLTACLASGHRAAQGVLRGLADKPHTI
jgi:predicted flavoprotein YhiN